MFVKDPGARLDYRMDWADRLPPDSTLVASSWTSSPAGLELSDMAQDEHQTLVWISGGTAGLRYRVTNRVQFSDGAIDERTILVRVEQR